MFNFRLISLTMPQANIAEPACNAVAFFASPLSASECGLVKRDRFSGTIERTVASAATTMAITLAGKRQVVTGNPKGEILAGGTAGSWRSNDLLAYTLSGGNDGGRIATGIAEMLSADAHTNRGSSLRSEKLHQPYQYGLQLLHG